jgi:large repetitive protein
MHTEQLMSRGTLPNFSLENTNSNLFRRATSAMRGALRYATAGVFVLLPGISIAHGQAVFAPQPVNTTSATVSVTVMATTAGTASTVDVLTAGASGLDFAAVSAGSTCPGAALASGGKCTENVTFTPGVPGLRVGAVVLVGTVSGVPTVLGFTYIQGTGTASLGVLIPGNENTMAGDGNYLGALNDGGPATAGELYLPTSVVLDGAGNLYIADSAHNRIRMVCASATSATIAGTACTGAGIISTIAGNGTAGTSPNGPASTSLLNNPSGIAIDGAGDLFLADTGNSLVREIVAATGEMVTVAGGATTVCAGATDAVGDGCPALQATLNQPLGVTLDEFGNLYIADTANARIRAVPLSTGDISTVAGDGTAGYNGDNITAITAEIDTPYAVAFDGAGNLYIPDAGNNRVREVAAVGGSITPASKITTFAGTGAAGDSGDQGAAANAELWAPAGLAFDPAGNLYIADMNNNAIRKVNSVSGNISTLIQDGEGSDYAGGAFSSVSLLGPIGLVADGSGNLWIADSLDMEVRQVQGNLAALDYTTPVRVGTVSTAMPATVENDGNLSLDLTAINPLANAQVDPLTTTCNTGTPQLAVSADCIVGAIFAPTTAANPQTGNIDVTSATVNSPLDIELVGIALAANSTTTVVTSAPDPSTFGQAVTFTITVTTGTGTGNLTGTVSLSDTFNGATTVLATGLALNTAYQATFNTAALAVGVHKIEASYSGDSGHLASSSTDYGAAPLLQTVYEQTATTLTSSVNPSALGQNVTFTATVAISGGGGVTPTGSVTFMDGNVALGTVPVATVGATTSAAFTTNTLTLGVHAITAVYNGDPDNEVLGSTSDVLDQDVQATTTVALTSSLNPSTYGQTVTFTATITSSSPTAATGTVLFYDGTNLIGSGILAGNPAVATFSIATLNVGTHPITASYAGDTNNSAGVSAAVNQVVNLAATTIALISAPNPSNFGQAVTFTVTVNAAVGTGNLTGTVSIADTFKGVTTNLATGLALNPSGVATFTISTLAVGQHSIVATYGGDTNHASSSSAPPLMQSVLESTATTLTSSANPSLFGQSVTFTATVTAPSGGGVTPDGTVNFLDGATVIGTGTLAGGVATFATATLAIGVHSITAVYTGDAANGIVGSTSAVLSQDVQATTTVALASSLNPSFYGQSVTFTATVSSSSTVAATGTVTFLDGGKVIATETLAGLPAVAAFTTSTLAVGTHPITVTYAGDSNNSSGTSPVVNEVVNQAMTATTVTAVPNPALAGEQITITATVKVTSGVSTPTGTVAFTSGTTVLGTAPLSSSGTATITPSLAAGTYNVVATYSGDTDDAGSASAALALTVNLATSTATLTITPNPATIGATVTFTANVAGSGVAPTGTVTFLNGTAVLGTATLTSGTATFTTSTLAVGSYAVTASYGGDQNNSPSVSAVVNLTVELIPTTTSLVASTTSGSNPQTVLVAVVEGTTGPIPTGTINFVSGGNTLGTGTLDSSGVVTFDPTTPGTYSVVAVYSGDTLHAPSTSAPVTVSAPSTFGITVVPASVSLAASQKTSVTVNLTSEGGFSDTIGLGCASLPAGVTCIFSSPTVKLAANATASAQLTIDTNNPLGGGATAMNSRGGRTASLAGLFLPFGIFFGWFFARIRRRSFGALTLILVLALSAGAFLASGCSGVTSSSAQPGTYTIQVTGTGASSGAIQYQNVSLTITQ